ncbi:NrfD/PsrC family molybdoenzyme membrane anchor subunit [Actinokineospora sp.]|uniref:NrfD/PsrC family molybdoenzyme membrane anchor subunit n=1 Tax=Actinokineospora sp. TaxID=1872133 RepID=UPI004037CFD0
MPATPWGPLIALYFVLIGLPSGLTLVSCWRTVRWPHVASRTDQAARVVALVALLLVSVVLVVDLGRPERSFLMLTQFGNLGSPIAVGAKLIAVKILLLVLDLYLRHRARGPGGLARIPADRRTSMVVGTVTWMLAAVSLALAVYPAAVLSRTWLSPLSATSGAALVYLVTSVLMGVAAHLAIDSLLRVREQAGSLRMPALVLLGVHAVVLAFQVVALVGDPRLDPAVIATFATASGATLWWGLSVGVGVVVPAGGLAIARTGRGPHIGCATAILVGACACRYLLFAAGG